VTDWATISSIGTAAGTLALAVATLASVRSANRAARVAERSLLAGLRPLLVPSRLQDDPQKVGFVDEHWLTVEGGRAAAEVTPEAVYLVISLRNVGAGMAVLHGWSFEPRITRNDAPPELDTFTRLSRDLYVPPGEIGFWQGSFRDPASDAHREAAAAVTAGEGFIVVLLYGDHEGGQRVMSRFALRPTPRGGFIATAARHWNVDRDDPR
jgi:hypothetical protein